MTAHNKIHRMLLAAGSLAGAVVLTVPGEASGASGAVWDRVAACESSGNWHINTGNGYYGGLQFSRSTWSAYRLSGYPDRADLASRTQQINVAERVLNAQGPGAWPVCGPRAGLQKGSGAPRYRPRPNRPSAPDSPRRRHPQHVPAPSAEGSQPPAAGVHRVSAGECLSVIGARYGTGWRQVYALNRDRIRNPALIYPGQLLRVPVSAG